MTSILGARALRNAACGAIIGAVAVAVAGGAASAQEPGMQPSPYVGPRTLPGLWSDAVKTGLLFVCAEAGCDVIDASTDDAFRYELTPITVAWQDGAAAYEVTIESVVVTLSTTGVDALQGIPENATIEIIGVGVNDALAAEIVAELGVDELAADLIARELVNERLSMRIDAAFGAEDFVLSIELSLLSDDAIGVVTALYLPPALRQRAVEQQPPLDVSVLDIEIPALRALSVLTALDLEVLAAAPVTSVEFTFVENLLLDKVYAVALTELGNAGEMAFWQEFTDAIVAVPAGEVSEDARASALELVGFYSGWRESGRAARILIEDPRAGELNAGMTADELLAIDAPYCSVGVAAGVVVGVSYGAAPYVWEESSLKADVDASEDPHALGKLLVNALDPSNAPAAAELDLLWREARCTPTITVEQYTP